MPGITERLAPLTDPANRWLRRRSAWWVYAIAGLLVARVVVLLLTGGLGVDPLRELEHRSGTLALQFIVAGLAVTPLRRIAGLNLMRFRRALGLSAFWIALAHLGIWIFLDMGLRWGQMGQDILKRPYITLGMGALLLMLPLALTSNSWSIRRMGAGWRRLHRLIYPAAILAGLHFLLLVKAWPLEPIYYFAAIVLLLLWRLVVALMPARGRAAARQ